MLARPQLECLAWVAAGKSFTDIGADLGLSAHMVDEQVAANCARDWGRTGIQAVAGMIARLLTTEDP